MFWLIWLCVAGAALALWTVLSALRAEREYPASGAFIEVSGSRLHYVRRGAGPSIVLLHGSDGSLLDFSETVLETLSLEFDVVAFDRPGHGYSDPPRHGAATPEKQLALIREGVQRLGLHRPLLVGHSWAALLVMMYAIDYPAEVAGVALLAPWVAPPASPASPLLYAPRLPLVGDLALWTLHRLLRGAIVGYFLRLAFLPAPAPRAYRRQALACWLRWPRQVKVFARENTSDRAAMERYSPRYCSVGVPVEIVAGVDDRLVSTERHAMWLHRLLPGSGLEVLAGTGHQILHTCPEPVCAALRRCAERARESSSRDEQAVEQTPHYAVLPARDLSRARDLVLKYGWNATSYQILNPAMEHWFADPDDAVIGFVRRAGFRIVAGAPVCAAERLAETVQEFEAEAAMAGEKVCYFGAAERLRAVLRRLPGHSELAIGAQPTWDPRQWPALLKRNSSLRSQINRARNKGVVVEEWGPEQAERRGALEMCLREWLDNQPFPTLRFLTEPVDLARLGDRRLFVACMDTAVSGFLIATPVPERNGWLVEQIVRSRSAPNGSAEMLVGTAMERLAADGAEYVTLGLAPLSSRGGPAAETGDSGLRLVLRWIRAHGRRFYNFDGLDAFKAKFKPDRWEPLYAITNERRFSMRALYGIAAAFSEGPPLMAMLRAAQDAARQELSWFRARREAPSAAPPKPDP